MIPSRNLCSHHRGFTLIELAVVVGVIIILLAVATPSLGGMLQEKTVYSVAYQLQQDIRVVQQYAITRRVPSSISFDTAGQTYTYTVGTTTRVRHMTSVVQMDGFSGTLSFDSFGSPGTPGALTAAVEIGFKTASGSKRMIVAIQPVLGRVDTTWVSR